MAIIESIPLSARTRTCALKRIFGGCLWEFWGILGTFETGRIVWEEALAKLAVTFTNAIRSKSKDQSIVPIAGTA
jgi:hypothetical protein